MRKLFKSRSAPVRKAVMNIYEEAYLYLGDKLNLEGIPDNELKKFNKYKEDVSKSDMKIGFVKKKREKKVKK